MRNPQKLRKNRLSTREKIELRNNRKLLLSKLEMFKQDFDFAERRGMKHSGLVHLYYNEMQTLFNASKEYEKKCRIFPSASDISRKRLTEFYLVCEQDLKRRDKELREKGHTSNYISWNILMLDTSLEVMHKSLLEMPVVEQQMIF